MGREEVNIRNTGGKWKEEKVGHMNVPMGKKILSSRHTLAKDACSDTEYCNGRPSSLQRLERASVDTYQDEFDAEISQHMHQKKKSG